MLACVVALGITSCATAPDRPQPAREDVKGMPADEQDKRALELFRRIYDTFEKGNRAQALPEVERLYGELIDTYPEAALAQESYWRLILIFLNDHTPPAFDRAEAYYNRFMAKYPSSQVRGEIDKALSDSYYRNRQWDRLLKFYTPAIKLYIEKGKLSKPQDMFMYAEAKLNLGDLVEAEKGYRIVIALFPRTRESALSSERLEEIRKRKPK